MEASKETVRKVGKNVSFVGLHNTNEGIIGFADSKATLSFETGKQEEDIARGKILKVFKNNQFIFVTFGNNQIFSEVNKMNIEDYIKANLKDDMDYETFFRELDEKVQEDNADYNDGIYNFIIGSKNKNGKYFLARCLIKQGDRIKYYDKDYGKKVYYGGAEDYCKVYSVQHFYSQIDINKYAIMIKDSIENIIKSKDSFSEIEYNPAGIPVNIAIFQ